MLSVIKSTVEEIACSVLTANFHLFTVHVKNVLLRGNLICRFIASLRIVVMRIPKNM
jgi:hypothetical protein